MVRTQPEQAMYLDFDDKSLYINRHLSWLSFNERVLEEAKNLTNPLMERLKFISITSSNLDEFIMIRVAELKKQIRAGLQRRDSKTDMTTREQLAAISEASHRLMEEQYDELHNVLFPALKAENIEFLKAIEMTEEQSQFASSFFYERVFPVLTPMAVDSSRPFPILMNRTLNTAVRIEKLVGDKVYDLIAVVQVPAILPRYVQLPGTKEKLTFILLEELISHYIAGLFIGHKVKEVYPFRITRNADLPLHEEGVEDLLEEIEKELIKREMGTAVRLEIDETMSDTVLDFLMDCLELDKEDIYRIPGPLDLTFLMAFSQKEQFVHLRNKPLYPNPLKEFSREPNVFQAIAEHDILLHTPYQSFESVIDFIRTAAEDPHVLAIKQTLYRVSGDSPIVTALAEAAQNGKQVFVLVELKARFDEENNIEWAKRLEESGCHVIYGFVGLKTHSKIAMVVRQEGELIKRYVHLGTGNYNDTTAKFYTDLSVFTCRKEVGEDATLFFNHLSGYSDTPAFKELIIAPSTLRTTLLHLIQNEIKKTNAKQPGRIIAKMNALTDKEMIKALYVASQAGVKIDLIVRGICCLRPGIPGVSDNIRVISIVGRFLEHSRIYYFGNGGEEKIYLSSADWMTRNLDRRIEILFPIHDLHLRERLKQILSILLSDNVKAKELKPDGTYEKVEDGKVLVESHLALYQEATEAFEEKEPIPFAYPRYTGHISNYSSAMENTTPTVHEQLH
jgi:polyphosphate kinase